MVADGIKIKISGKWNNSIFSLITIKSMNIQFIINAKDNFMLELYLKEVNIANKPTKMKRKSSNLYQTGTISISLKTLKKIRNGVKTQWIRHKEDDTIPISLYFLIMVNNFYVF